MTATQDTSRIHAKAMLVSLNITQWAARKIDRKAASDVAAANNVTSSRGAYYKSLVEGGQLEDIRKIATEARHEHYRRTLPWSDAGPRVLSNLGYLDYMQAMQQYGQRFDAAVAQFVKDYPHLRHEAQILLGNLFSLSDYPAIDHVLDKFSFRTTVAPLPMGDDFRCDLGTEEVERIRAEITATTTATATLAVKEAFKRIDEVVSKFVDRLEMPDTVFRESMVDNLHELVGLLPGLNFTGDAKLEELTNALRDKLCGFSTEQLRNNVTERTKAFTQASAIKSDLMAYFNGDLS